MLFLGTLHPCIYLLLPHTVLTLLFYVFFLVGFGQFRSISVTFGNKYYRTWVALSLGWIDCKPTVTPSAPP